MKECGYKENEKCNTCAECMSCPENNKNVNTANNHVLRVGMYEGNDGNFRYRGFWSGFGDQ